MIENTIAFKRTLKKQNLLDAIVKASEDKNDWKKRQLEGKLAMFERRNYPRVLWDSYKKGTYKKERKEK